MRYPIAREPRWRFSLIRSNATWLVSTSVPGNDAKKVTLISAWVT